MIKTKYTITEAELELLIQELPANIANSVVVFDSQSERLISLYGSITAAGCLMTNVTGEYHRRIVYPHLYTGIVAPPASNKGVISYAAKLLARIDDAFRINAGQQQELYNEEMRKHNSKKGSTSPIPVKPKYKVVNISGNITASKLIEQLDANQLDIPSIIIEDEIDTLAVAGSGEHGQGLSAILRTVFHHGIISQQLKSGNTHFHISNPRLAILIGGTPKQMQRLIGNIENGLYSRFLILILEDGAIWQNVMPCPTCPDRNEIFKRIADLYHNLWDYLKDREIEVKIREKHWDLINAFGRTQTGVLCNFSNEMLSAVIKRHGLMAFKIAMTLTALRSWENNSDDKVVYCSDADFDIALKMMYHSFQCSVAFFKNLPGGADTLAAKGKERLLSSLPDDFIRAEAINNAKSLGISDRQADRFLKQLLQSGILEKAGQGKYKKLPLAKPVIDEIDEM